jgi:gluconolactonase
MQRRTLLTSALALTALHATGADAETSSHAPGEMTTFASGLRFPEGPLALKDGSALVCEIGAGRVTHVTADGKPNVVAETGGSPAGCAIGPDGALYVANLGGLACEEKDGRTICMGQAADYKGGLIQRVDLKTKQVAVLYSEVDGNKLSAPDDLVFDAHGGFWFADAGSRGKRARDYAGLYYAKADGSLIREVVYPMSSTNGICLAPDGQTVYVAVPEERTVVAFPVTGEGTVDRGTGFKPGRVVIALPPDVLLDSMKMEADGTLCLCSVLGKPGIIRVKPNGQIVELVKAPNEGITNLAFGGKDLRTAFLTDSIMGRLLKTTWPAPGLKLNYQTV